MEIKRISEDDCGPTSHLIPAFMLENIRVVQALRLDGPREAQDTPTGSELRDDVLQPLLATERFWSEGILQVANGAELTAAFQILVDEAAAKGWTGLILVVEAHGSSKGINLPSGEFVPWSRLAALFRPLNLACRNNLFVILAACNGGHLAGAVALHERTPFWGWFGPHGEIHPEVLRAATHEFMRSLVRTLNLSTAFEEAKANASREALERGLPDAIGWVMMSAESLYDRVSHDFVEDRLRGRRFLAWVERVVTKARTLDDPRLRVLGLARFRRLVKRSLRGTDESRERDRRHFLNLDRFPDQEARFAAARAAREGEESD